MKFVADLHLHSKYSRAVSQQMVLAKMVEWARYKGISVLATGDFTHPYWFETLRNELEEARNGLYKLKTTVHSPQTTAVESRRSTEDKQDVYFLLSCEISSIYTQGDKVRRIHNLFFFPSIASVEKLNNELLKRGANLRSDGRPIVGISSRDLAQIALSCDQKALIIPAHAWTPWFSIFGSFSGFDSIEECFRDMAGHIYAIETGLSSDPAMNWRIADLEGRSILSFSDAHSLMKMGREATVFEAEEISYDSIYNAIIGTKRQRAGGDKENDSVSFGSSATSVTSPQIAFTIEFYPEEGKYHFTGHRNCNFSQSPRETEKDGNICPVCGRQLTIGVMHRVEELATQNSRLPKPPPAMLRNAMRAGGTGGQAKFKIQNINGVRWVYPEGNSRPPYVSLVPLDEILAEALGSSVGTKKVMDQYMTLVGASGSEFNVLLKTDLVEIAKYASSRVVEGIGKIRSGDIVVEPGYDGKYGVVKIWQETQEDTDNAGQENQKGQLNLFA